MLKKLKKLIRGDKNNQPIKWSLYGRVWREVGLPYWKWLAAGIIFTVAAASAEGWAITIAKKIVDETFIAKNLDSLYIIGAQIILAYGAKGLFTFIKAIVMAKAGLLTSANLQRRIYRHVIRMNISTFYGDGIGKCLNYFSVQAGAVLTLVTGTIVRLIQNIATIAISIGLMVWFAPQLCALLIFLAPAIIIPTALIMRAKRRLSRESFAIANNVTQHLNQTLRGIKTIQAFANEECESCKFNTILDSSISNSLRATKVSALRSPLLELMISIGLCVAMTVGGVLLSNNIMTLGDFVGFLLALSAAYRPTKNITSTGDTVQHGLLAAEILFNFLDSKPLIQDAPDAKPLTATKMSVKFENVHFEYNPGEPVLRGIDLNVPAGKICALVGQSGGGKTTMFSLLERFYAPQVGKIKINNTNIDKFTLESLRKNIAEVSQDVFLFNDTIEENIKYGVADATHDQVVAAARAANADEFISKFPNGYETSVGEGGALLSGGQKQRIAIARAILKNAPILLLDEATSALDTQSEKLIQSALRELMRGRTTFVIAHRLSTILDADIICVVKDGQIIERGTDAELVAQNGEYKKLRDIQFAVKKTKKAKKTTKK